MNKTFLFLVVIFISACTSVSGEILNDSASGFESNSFAVANIEKPTYTPTSTIVPSATVTLAPTSEPTSTPEAIAQAEIILDTPTSNINVAAQNYQAEAPITYTGGKYILVDISQQHMYVYEGDTLVYSFIASTGINNATRVGSFSVLDKIPNAYGATWDLWMPNWLGIYWAGSLENGIHALPILSNGVQLWAGYLGVPISYGCVVLGTYESQLLYNWADVGTPVDIQW
jgi:lipoprotein-anchoring transpeptidase ErfK/SrfK